MSVSREAFSAVNQSLQLNVAGNTYVGFGITGTFAGTLSFSGSTDGVNFTALSVYAYPMVDGGTSVQSVTATGNYVVPVNGLIMVKVAFTAKTSGTPVVAIASSVDGSYADAYSAETVLSQTSSASHAINTLTIAANTNHGWRIDRLICSQNGTATTPQITIKSGTTTLAVIDLPVAAGDYDVTNFCQGMASDPNALLSVSVGDLGVSISSNINLRIHAA